MGGSIGDVVSAGTSALSDPLGGTLGGLAGQQRGIFERGTAGIFDPNIKTRDAQTQADQLREAIIARRGQLEGLPGFQDLPAAERFQAEQIQQDLSIDPASDIRGQVLGYTERLADTDVPSTAMAQHRMATDRGVKQAMALAASQRNPAALRQALEAQAGIQGQAALQSGLVRSQEAQRQQAALAQAAGLASGLRGQDISRSTSQRKLELERERANQAARQEAGRFGAEAANQRAVLNERLRQAQEAERQRQIGQTFGQQQAAVGTTAGIAGGQEQRQQRRTEGIVKGLGEGIASIAGG